MKYLKYLILSLFVNAFLTSCSSTQEIKPDHNSMIELREASNVLEKGYMEMIVEGSDRTIYVGDEIISSDEDIKSMESGFDPQGFPIIVVTLTEMGKIKFSAATKRLIKKYIAVLINGKVVMAPFVQEQLETDTFVISGDLTLEEIDEIVSGFN